jgi:colanic acid/amylovoran/stewartan biosynthesis glycosyltransferase WcaL/AmsK/CpsK
MKTAAIVYEFPCRSETFVLGQIRGLIELGCDMRIFADNRDPVTKSQRDDEETSLLDRVSYFGLPLKQLRETVGRVRSRYPVTVESGSVHRPARRLHETAQAGLRLRLEARAFGRNAKFDIIHAHFGPNGVRAVRLRRMGSVAGPVLTSFYGYDVSRHWSRAGYEQLFSEGERFTALSNHMRDSLVALGCPAERTIIHRLGVDVGRFRMKSRTENSRLELISVARLIPKKGIEYALRAVAALTHRKIAVRYTVVGGGPLRDRLEKLANDLKLGDAVVFAGPQPQSAIVQMLQRSDVLLAPSVTAIDGDAEGTPVAILEAQSCGIPVVSTLHAGIPEVVENGRSGFLVPEADVAAMAARIEELSESRSLRQEMGDAGRAVVIDKHDIAKLNLELFAVYQSLA